MPKYEDAKTLAVPFQTLAQGVKLVFRALAPMEKGRPNPKDPTMEPGLVMRVEALEIGGVETDGEYVLGIPAIAASELGKYPKDSYVGKIFGLTKLPKTGGGKANPVRLTEIKVTK